MNSFWHPVGLEHQIRAAQCIPLNLTQQSSSHHTIGLEHQYMPHDVFAPPQLKSTTKNLSNMTGYRAHWNTAITARDLYLRQQPVQSQTIKAPGSY